MPWQRRSSRTWCTTSRCSTDWESAWSWYTYETEKLQRSWGAVERLEAIRRETFRAVQRFGDYAELVSRVEVLGEPALTRIKEFEGQREIEIAMPYGMALLSGARA